MPEHMGVIESLRHDPGDEAAERYRRQYERDLRAELGAEALRELRAKSRRQPSRGGE